MPYLRGANRNANERWAVELDGDRLTVTLNEAARVIDVTEED